MLCLLSVTSLNNSDWGAEQHWCGEGFFFWETTQIQDLGKLNLPSPTGVGPVEEFVHGCDPFPAHGGHVPSCHDGIIHARVHS